MNRVLLKMMTVTVTMTSLLVAWPPRALGATASSAAELWAPAAEDPALLDEAWTVSELNITHVRLRLRPATRVEFRPTAMEVSVTAWFANPCVVPAAIVRERLDADSDVRDYRVRGAHDPRRGCTHVLAPVSQDFVIERFVGSDALPEVRVNGIPAEPVTD